MKSILIIGLGSFGNQLIDQIVDLKHDIMAVDKTESKVNDVLPKVTEAVIGDATNIEFLKTLGIDNYDVCFVCISDDFQSSLETTSLLQELGARKIVSLASRSIQEKFLLRNGADAVVYPNKEVSRLAAVRYTTDNIVDYTTIDNTHAVALGEAPKQYVNKSLGELQLNKAGINVLAIEQNGIRDYTLHGESIIPVNSKLLILGEIDLVKRFFK